MRARMRAVVLRGPRLLQAEIVDGAAFGAGTQHDGPVRRGHGVRDVAGPEEARGTPLPTLPRLGAKEQEWGRAGAG